MSGNLERSGICRGEAMPCPYTSMRTQERGKHRCQPVGLFTVLGALQRPRHTDHGTLFRNCLRETLDATFFQVTQARSPATILGLPIGLAKQIGQEIL